MSIPQRTSAPPIRGRWALPIAAGAGFLAGLDTTAVNLALPDIQRTLAAGAGELPWVVNAFALLIAVAARTALPGSAGDRRARFDYAGVATFTLGLGVLLYAALRSNGIGWANAEVPTAAAVGIAGLAAFVAIEHRTADGVVDLRL